MRRSFIVLVCLAAACGKSSSSSTATPEPDAGVDAATPTGLDCGGESTEWTSWGGNLCNARALSKSGALAKDTVSKLAVKWTFDAKGDVSATPAVVGGQVYVPDWGGMLHKLDAASGSVVWSKNVADLAGVTNDAGAPVLGFASRTTPIVTSDSVIIGTMRQVPNIVLDPRPGAFIVAVDRDTGAVKWRTPLHENHPAAVITASPILEGGKIYVGVASLEEVFPGNVTGYTCCSFRGSVAALDAATGKLLWQTHTIKDGLYFGQDGTTPSGYAGAGVWSSAPAIDRKRRQIYVTTGDDYNVPAGVSSTVDGNGVNSIMALDMDTGAVKWSRSFGDLDVWTFANMLGPDADFGCGANLFSAQIGGKTRDLVGAGQKSGVYWAVDADTGELVWKTQVGPGGHLGGIHWGTAVDGQRIYVGVNNEMGTPFALGGTGKHAGEMSSVGAWAALDPATGAIVWQVANPAHTAPLDGASVNGPVTVVNGVVFAGSMDDVGTMFAFDAATGDVLWSFKSGGTVYGAPAIADGVVYWGSGYPSARLKFGTPSKKLYAFALP